MNTKIIYECTYIYNEIPGRQGTTQKKDSQEYKTPWPVTAGQAWILVEDLEYQSPSLNSELKATEEAQEHFSEGSKVIFVPWRAKQRSDVFSGSFCGLRQSSMLSSNEPLPNRECSLGTSPGNHQEAHLSSILCLCHTYLLRWTHFHQPLASLHQVQAQVNARTTWCAWSNCRPRVKQMLTLEVSSELWGSKYKIN